jgi:hypothetical protein
MFDRICRENAITHRLTKPRSPTTTGKVERFHQTLQRELLDDHPPFASIVDAQAAIDTFRHDYNTDRPHQSLDMDFPADRFVACVDDDIPLRLPPSLESAEGQAIAAITPVVTSPDGQPLAVAGSTGVAVEVIRTVPASGNLAVCGQQFWLGLTHVGREITLWADTTVVHLLLDGSRLKTVPSRLTQHHLRQLLTDGGRPAGPPPISTGPVKPGGPVEVDRLVNATGLLALAGRQHPVGYHLAGRRVTARLDHGVLHLLDSDRTVLRSLPNPLTPADLARLRDARPGGPPPTPTTEALRVDRRVSSRGSITIAGQRIQVGIGHTVTVEETDTSFRVLDGDQLLTEVPRTTTETSNRVLRCPSLTPRSRALSVRDLLIT